MTCFDSYRIWYSFTPFTHAAHLIAFNVAVPKSVESFAEANHLTLRKHRIIYELLDDITEAMTKLLPPTTTQVQTGAAEILQVRDMFLCCVACLIN